MCPCDSFLEVYKVDRTFRIETPETIDPDRTNPNAPMVAVVADRVGSADPIVARVLLQGKSILEAVILKKAIEVPKVLMRLHAIKERLVICRKAEQHIERGLNSADETLRGDAVGHGRTRSLPQVTELEQHIVQFLTASKRAIADICALVPHFLDVERADMNFDHLYNRLHPLLGDASPLVAFISDNRDIVRQLLELRNAQEHPKGGQRLHIVNYRVQPDGSVAGPAWNITGRPAEPVRGALTKAIDQMVDITELMVVHLIDECLDIRWPFVLQEIMASERNVTIPMRFTVGLDTSRLTRAERDVRTQDPV